MFGVGLGFVRRAGRRVARSCVDLFLGPDRAELRRLVRQGRVVMGIGSYGIPKVRVFTHEDSVRLVVGNYCSIAEEALFLLGGEHPTDRLSTFPFRLRFGLEGGEMMGSRSLWETRSWDLMSGLGPVRSFLGAGGSGLAR